MVLCLFWIGEDRLCLYVMMLFGFFLDGVVGGFWGWIVCWFKIVGKFLFNVGFGIVVIEGEGLVLIMFFVFIIVVRD